MTKMFAARFKIQLPVIGFECIFVSMNQKSQYKGYGIKFYLNLRAANLRDEARWCAIASLPHG